LGTVGGSGTPTGSLSFRPEYEQPSGNQLEPKEKVENGLAWMTDLYTGSNSSLGGNGIEWTKNRTATGVTTGARIWYQPGSFTSTGSGSAGNHGRLNLSAGHTTASVATPDITITSNKRVGIGTTSPTQKLHVEGGIYVNGGIKSGGYVTTNGIATTIAHNSWVNILDFRSYTYGRRRNFIQGYRHGLSLAGNATFFPVTDTANWACTLTQEWNYGGVEFRVSGNYVQAKQTWYTGSSNQIIFTVIALG
jgi:hypothetical protein